MEVWIAYTHAAPVRWRELQSSPQQRGLVTRQPGTGKVRIEGHNVPGDLHDLSALERDWIRTLALTRCMRTTHYKVWTCAHSAPRIGPCLPPHKRRSCNASWPSLDRYDGD